MTVMIANSPIDKTFNHIASISLFLIMGILRASVDCLRLARHQFAAASRSRLFEKIVSSGASSSALFSHKSRASYRS
jgi:hypothetical protein